MTTRVHWGGREGEEEEEGGSSQAKIGPHQKSIRRNCVFLPFFPARLLTRRDGSPFPMACRCSAGDRASLPSLSLSSPLLITRAIMHAHGHLTRTRDRCLFHRTAGRLPQRLSLSPSLPSSLTLSPFSVPLPAAATCVRVSAVAVTAAAVALLGTFEFGRVLKAHPSRGRCHEKRERELARREREREGREEERGDRRDRELNSVHVHVHNTYS